MINQDRGVYY